MPKMQLVLIVCFGLIAGGAVASLDYYAQYKAKGPEYGVADWVGDVKARLGLSGGGADDTEVAEVNPISPGTATQPKAPLQTEGVIPSTGCARSGGAKRCAVDK